jgi:hypothetical protein
MIVRLFRKLYHNSPNLVHHNRHLVFVVLLSCYLLTHLTPTYAQAQPEIPSYWQYAASGRLLHVEPADVDRDGVDEFLVADENGRVDLIRASGRHAGNSWRLVQ